MYSRHDLVARRDQPDGAGSDAQLADAAKKLDERRFAR